MLIGICKPKRKVLFWYINQSKWQRHLYGRCIINKETNCFFLVFTCIVCSLDFVHVLYYHISQNNLNINLFTLVSFNV